MISGISEVPLYEVPQNHPLSLSDISLPIHLATRTPTLTSWNQPRPTWEQQPMQLLTSKPNGYGEYRCPRCNAPTTKRRSDVERGKVLSCGTSGCKGTHAPSGTTQYRYLQKLMTIHGPASPSSGGTWAAVGLDREPG